MIRLNNCFEGLLGGGLPHGVLTQIYGPPGSGKTNVCLMATCSAASQGKVIYIDPEGGFSVERLRQIAGAKFTKTLENILLVEPTTFDEQKVALSKLDELVPKTNASLVVVDGIAMLYRIEEDKNIKELGRMLAQLLRVARRYNLPVLITNQIYTDIDTHRNVPIGGIINEYWSKIIIELGISDDGARYALLKKHLNLPEGMRVDYRIVNEGIASVRETVKY
ncbi:MAG: DNA repair and recombination protein RadB [Candidatus Altiarchaeota archaeon]|nr:DNA repair and recombination protein RadB [Candidatus Altiarchaeota archaeon]